LKILIFSPFFSPRGLAVTVAFAASAPTWVLPSSSTTSNGWNVMVSPSWTIFSTSITSPVCTLCCLPPVLITAYMVGSFRELQIS